MTSEALIDWQRVALTDVTPKGVELYPPYEREMFTELFVSTGALILAIQGEGADLTAKMANFLRFVETPLGNALAVCAGESRRRGPVARAAFAASVQLPGYDLVRAVAAWINSRPPQSLVERYFKVKQERPLSEHESDYFDRLLRESIPPGLVELESHFRQWQRAFEAGKKRKVRAKPARKPDAVREVIARDWITCALWCRTTKGILAHYPDMPQEGIKTHEASCHKIENAISLLGFSKSRKTKNNAAIEAAEAAVKERLNSPR